MKRAKRRNSPRALPKPRNPVATSPLLRKGGANGKTKAAKRRLAKVELERIKRDPDLES